MTGSNKQIGDQLSEKMMEMMLVPGISRKVQQIAKYHGLETINGNTLLRDAAKELQKLYPELVYNPMTTTATEYNNALDIVINRENVT